MDQIMAQNKGKKRKVDRPFVAGSGPPSKRVLPPMPVEIMYGPARLTVSFENDGDAIVFRSQIGRVQEFQFDQALEPYRVREIFLDVQTPGEAIEFLSSSGFFSYPTPDGHGGGVLVMTWAEFQQWQELIRRILTDGFLKLKETQEIDGIQRLLLDAPTSTNALLSRVSPREQVWLTGRPQGIVVEPRGGNPGPFGRDEPVALIPVGNTLEAILATIYLDHLNGFDHALCGLKDCRKIYEVTSKHARLYCSPACAHKASVRRRRALAAQAKAKPSKFPRVKRGTKQ